MGIIVKKSILSGILVGTGVITNILVSNPYIGAMLFSLALLVIIKCDLYLYTGKIGFIESYEISTLITMLLGNLTGIAITMFVSINKYGFYQQLIDLSNAKFSQGYIELFLYALMCGALMFIAVYCKETIITVFCIMTFILSGYEHCIADFPYLFVNFNTENFLKFLCIVLGNSIGSIVINKLIK